MARNGGNPNIAEIGKKTQFGAERGYNAVKAAKKSNDIQAQKKKIAQDLFDRSTPEVIGEANDRLLQKVLQGDLKAYEMWVAMLGEKPGNESRLNDYTDDGFLEALEGTAAEDWTDEEEQTVV